MRPESLGLVEELIFGRDFCRKTVAIGRPKNGVSEGIDRYNARYACDMQKPVSGFCCPAILLGNPAPQSLGLRKTAFFSVAPTGVVAADAAFPFCGKAAPVTILVKAKILKTAKCEEEAKSWQGQRKMNR